MVLFSLGCQCRAISYPPHWSILTLRTLWSERNGRVAAYSVLGPFRTGEQVRYSGESERGEDAIKALT